MNSPEDESAAIAAAANGDADAFGPLVERYQDVAFRAAYLITRDAAGAEDVCQEAFVRAFRGLKSFRREEPFRPWLLRIVTNLALNEVRGRGRRFDTLWRFGVLSRSTPEPGPEGGAVAKETHAMLWDAIHELRHEDQVVLYLRHFLELPEREIAVAIGRPEGTVKSRLHRASGRLRIVIEERYPALHREDA